MNHATTPPQAGDPVPSESVAQALKTLLTNSRAWDQFRQQMQGLKGERTWNRSVAEVETEAWSWIEAVASAELAGALPPDQRQ